MSLTIAGPFPNWRKSMTFSAETAVTFALGILTTLAAVFGIVWKRRESIEERLQRWQTETVERVTARAKELETEVLKLRIAVARVTHLELGLKIAVDELARVSPDNPVLLLLHDVLAAAYPIEVEAPEDIAGLIKKLKAVQK